MTDNPEPRISSQQQARLMRWATYASASIAIILIVAKMIAWMWSDSITILATLIDSCLDAAASMITLFAVHHALQPADKEHRFGHGKAEALAGLGQAMFIAGSAMFLLLESINRLLHPKDLEVIDVGIIVMILSIALTGVLILFQNYVVQQTGSTAIKADSLHYKTDLLVNFAVIIALLLAMYGWGGFDPIFAIVIAAYILHSAWEIGVTSVDELMDKEFSDAERDDIKTMVRGFDGVMGMHDLRTRKAGLTCFIQLHLELDGNLTLNQAHVISDQVEAMLKEKWQDAEIIIHEDPHGVDEPVAKFAT
ncbi:MAG: cation diffusion facilitator family transporter [Mariprofundaceae bacterium]|nr:cation diffusion facilitator family transporter [Mariprofundaceae bacterium]